MSFSACLALGQMDSILKRKMWSTCAGLSLGFYVYGLLYSFNLGLILGNYLIMRVCTSRLLAMRLMIGFSAACLLMA